MDEKDGRWKTTLPDKSKKNKRRLIAKRELKDLEEVLINYYSLQDDKEYVENNLYTLEKIFPLWLEYKASQTNSSSYAKRILIDWNKYYKDTDIVKELLSDLTYLKLDKWAHSIIKEYSLNKKQYYNMSIIMRQCLDYACEPEIGTITVNPFRRVRIKGNLFSKKEKPKSDTQVFMVDEQEKIRKTAKEKIAEHPWCTSPLMVLLNFQLGLRIGELCSIKWSDIEGKYIHIQRSEIEEYSIINKNGELISSWNGLRVVPYTKSEAGERKVYLNNEARKILSEIRNINEKYGYYDNDYIYIKSQGGCRGTTKAFSKYLYDLCIEAGIKNKSSHKIRKTYISSLFDRGININTIREQAGHEDERTSLNNYCFDQHTNVYIETELENASNKNTKLKV